MPFSFVPPFWHFRHPSILIVQSHPEIATSLAQEEIMAANVFREATAFAIEIGRQSRVTAIFQTRNVIVRANITSPDMAEATKNIVDIAARVDLENVASGLLHRCLVLGGGMILAAILAGCAMTVWFTGGRELLRNLTTPREG
ncbi:hypothetical protein QBC33DRAFT_517645 [Phialemonium atrogriseum]|uniref:Uncharacterized protein n=1 Tax=Phialemonium atrogriseum TaxID=1093897 RepID=A0AAJ0FJF0_9PEZI|nr:uncharacterized protein QBC33DRAFT_517645 [Phialemonium atrogriseum]KAK1764354.1 hypothetical protein QBC33DRAFT_517645 [Phialemonium atrogriseum]